MALFKPYKILSNKLSSLPVKEGQLIITTDTGDIYVDLSDSERKQLAVIDLSDYVTSSTLASSIAAEAQAREKQDGLLEDAIEGKLDTADLVEGSNITISTDGSGHVTIAANVPDVSDFITETEANAAYATKNHTHSVATDSANGFMSAADKEKLDTVQEGANKTVVDASLSSISTNPVQNKVINSALAGKANSSHNHNAADITSGTLALTYGGTGLKVNPSMLVNLGSTSTASVFTTSPRPGITGTLAITHGGTGATTAASARSNLGAAASDIITVSSTQPSSSTCKLWIKP